METIFPRETGFSGIFMVGFRKNPASNTATQRIGIVIVKRSYTINGNQLQPVADTTGIRIQDERDVSVDMDGDASTPDVALVTHESDIAPFKPQGDLFVKGFMKSNVDPASVSVNGTIWLSRPAMVPGCLLPEDVEVDENLFGWEQRGFDCRLSDVGLNPRDNSKKGFSDDKHDYPAQWNPGGSVPDFKDPLHGVGFSNLFFNAYKRAFKAKAGDFPYFQPDDEINLSRGGSQPASRSFSLSGESLSAAFYYYCGHGPDRDSRWCKKSLMLVRDTLVIEPQEDDSNDQAYLLWRGVWDFDDYDEDHYRRLKVSLEG